MERRFYVWSIGRYENEASVITPSEEIRNPLMIGHAYGSAGNIPVSSQGISVSEKGVQVSYFGENKDGEGILLRPWEQSGISGNCTVKLPDGVKVSSVQPVNLMGEKQGSPIQVKSGEFTVALKGYTPASFVL